MVRDFVEGEEFNEGCDLNTILDPTLAVLLVIFFPRSCDLCEANASDDVTASLEGHVGPCEPQSDLDARLAAALACLPDNDALLSLDCLLAPWFLSPLRGGLTCDQTNHG